MKNINDMFIFLEAQIELNNTRKIAENLERKLKEKDQEITGLNETVIEFNKNLEKYWLGNIIY